MVNIAIMRTFIRLRHVINTNKELAQKLQEEVSPPFLEVRPLILPLILLVTLRGKNTFKDMQERFEEFIFRARQRN